MRPVPVGLEPGLAALLSELRSAVARLQVPQSPVSEFATLEADLPPAESYKNCRVLVTDKNTLAISTLVGSTWTWLRADGSAI